MTKNVLVTGGLGFIGSNFLNKFVPMYPEYNFLNVDAEKYAASHLNVSSVVGLKNYSFLKANILDLDEHPIDWSDFDIVINFAAMSHVANSIQKPASFIDVNVKGTYNILQALRFVKEKFGKNIRYHHVSTDEVYGDYSCHRDLSPFAAGDRETTKYNPTNPYAASKAASDLLVYAYNKTYGLNVTITNCCNNYGPNQHEEKLVPKLIHNFIKHLPIPLHGDGQQIRDWLYVDDHCAAIWKVAFISPPGVQYNVSGGNHMSNLAMVQYIYVALQNMGVDLLPFGSYIQYVPDRAYNDREYNIDDSLLRASLDWKPVMAFDDGMKKTIEYYKDKWAQYIRYTI